MKIQKLVTLVAVVGLTLAFISQKNFLACNQSVRKDKEIRLGQQVFGAEVANTDATRQKGLGGRSCIGENQAMLFEFNSPGNYSFWMKDMKFPLDIVWLSVDKKVVFIKNNVSPATYPQSFVNNQPAQYVLEIKAGKAKQLSLTKDTSISF